MSNESRPVAGEAGRMRDVTAGIKAFLRQDELRSAIRALSEVDVAEVIVADDSGMPDERRKLYQELDQEVALRVLELPFDCGVSYGRNRIAEACRTDYLLLLDDDHVVFPNIELLREAIELRPDLGGVSGVWRELGGRKSSAGNLYRFGNRLYRDVGRGGEYLGRVQGRDVLGYDFIPLGGIFRLACLKEYPWDETYKTAREHLDYFLQHKVSGKWRFGLLDEAVLEHKPVDKRRSTGSYVTYRHGQGRHQASRDHFFSKWGIRDVVVGRTHTVRKSSIREGFVHLWLRGKLTLSQQSVT